MNRYLSLNRPLGYVIYLLTLMLIIPLWGCGSDSGTARREPIVIGAIDLRPHSYTENGKIIGVDVDVSTQAASSAGVDYTLEIGVNATELYNKTKAGPNRAIIGINYAEARKNDFKWVGPVSKSGFVIFTKKNSELGVGQDAAKNIPSIAVVSGWLETITLENQGFKNLRYFDTYEQAFTAFVNGDVKAIASDLMQFGYTIRGKYSITNDFDVCFSYKSAYYYIAFSKDVADSVISSMQSSLDELTRSGKTYEMLKKYFPTVPRYMSPDILQLLSEYAPPRNYYTGSVNNYQVAGSSVEIVNEIQKMLGGYASSISMTSWVDGYATVQELPNSALFTTARTPERENLFQWVGPIATMTPRFYTLKTSNINANTLEKTKVLKVGTPTQWYTYDYLKNSGFANIVTTYYPADSFKQLLNGVTDAIYIDAESIDWLCKETGVSRATLVQQPVETPQRQGYIAFSLNTPRKIIDDWQKALDAIKATGIFDRILLGWSGAV